MPVPPSPGTARRARPHQGQTVCGTIVCCRWRFERTHTRWCLGALPWCDLPFVWGGRFCCAPSATPGLVRLDTVMNAYGMAVLPVAWSGSGAVLKLQVRTGGGELFAGSEAAAARRALEGAVGAGATRA